jgi:hypothetical protein
MKTVIVTKTSYNTALNYLSSLPVDGTMEVEFRQVSKQRTTAQNSFQWADVLATIAEQATIEGRKYTAEIWHEYLKEKFLPNVAEEGITKKGYHKYIYMPDGSLKMVGSTTQLTKKGMAEYMTKVEAFASGELGVRFEA